ncbi:MAG TPA: Gfo/Idh/MocA family oxidoreductase [Proteobacteria bacterium]|nr:Gfo/Idh/MocA family oxidoreductase [Pseudomonadota bacterium]
MKILQIGSGRWGSNHLRILRGLGVEVFVAELAADERRRCLSEGLPADHVSENFEDFLDRVDAVDIVTPAQTHLPIAISAMARHKDIFCEKPLAENSAKADEFAAAVKQAGVLCQVGHVFRYDPASAYMKNAIEAGELGAIRSLSGSFSGFKRPRDDGGVTISDAIHFVDLFNYLLAATPDRVMAQCHDLLGRGLDDQAWLWLAYGETRAVIEANYFSPHKSRLVTVIGEKATLVCNFAAAQDKITIFNNRHVREQGTWQGIAGEIMEKEIPPSEPLLLELQDFIACVRGRRQPRAGAEAGAAAVRVIDAALEASRRQQTVTL